MKYLPMILALAAAAFTASAEPVDFSLESPADGKKIDAAALRGKFVALHFLLKTECPICMRHTRDFFGKAASLPNVAQVFIKPDSAEEIKAWAAKFPEPAAGQPRIPLYRDPDAKLAKRLKIPDGYQFHGETVHYPALVLLDPQGNEVFRHVGKSNSDRYSFERLAAKVAELSKP